MSLKGRSDGVQEGRAEERAEIACAMRRRGMSVAEIVEITGLSEEEVKRL